MYAANLLFQFAANGVSRVTDKKERKKERKKENKTTRTGAEPRTRFYDVAIRHGYCCSCNVCANHACGVLRLRPANKIYDKRFRRIARATKKKKKKKNGRRSRTRATG